MAAPGRQAGTRAHAPAVPHEIAFEAPAHVHDALGALARTEDVRLSPSGRRLAIAGFANGRIAIAEVEITRTAAGPEVAVTAVEHVESPAFQDPHGVDFVDEDVLVVANRGGGVAVLRLVPGGADLLATTGPVRTTRRACSTRPGPSRCARTLPAGARSSRATTTPTRSRGTRWTRAAGWWTASSSSGAGSTSPTAWR